MPFAPLGLVVVFRCKPTKRYLKVQLFLDGGNSNIFYVQPDPWGRIPNLTCAYFSKGLEKKTPTRFASGPNFCLDIFVCLRNDPYRRQNDFAAERTMTPTNASYLGKRFGGGGGGGSVGPFFYIKCGDDDNNLVDGTYQKGFFLESNILTATCQM